MRISAGFDPREWRIAGIFLLVLFSTAVLAQTAEERLQRILDAPGLQATASIRTSEDTEIFAVGESSLKLAEYYWGTRPLEVKVDGPCVLSFWMKFNSPFEYYYSSQDRVAIQVDASTYLDYEWETPWRQFYIPLDDGEHTITWIVESAYVPERYADIDFGSWVDGFQILPPATVLNRPPYSLPPDTEMKCNEQGNPVLIRLDWEEIPGALSYELSLNGSTFRLFETEFDFEVPCPLENYRFGWQVRGISDTAFSNWTGYQVINLIGSNRYLSPSLAEAMELPEADVYYVWPNGWQVASDSEFVGESAAASEKYLDREIGYTEVSECAISLDSPGLLKWKAVAEQHFQYDVVQDGRSVYHSVSTNLREDSFEVRLEDRDVRFLVQGNSWKDVICYFDDFSFTKYPGNPKNLSVTGTTSCDVFPCSLQLHFSWSAVADADRYELEIAGRSYASNTNSLDVTLAASAGSVTVPWKVRSVLGSTKGYWASSSFSTSSPASNQDPAIAEALNIPGETIWNGNAAPFIVDTAETHDGEMSAHMPANSSSSSVLRWRVPGPSRLSFWWKSDASEYGGLNFFGEGMYPNRALIRGKTPWKKVEVIFPEGWRDVEWTKYNYGLLNAWIDEVALQYPLRFEYETPQDGEGLYNSYPGTVTKITFQMGNDSAVSWYQFALLDGEGNELINEFVSDMFYTVELLRGEEEFEDYTWGWRALDGGNLEWEWTPFSVGQYDPMIPAPVVTSFYPVGGTHNWCWGYDMSSNADAMWEPVSGANQYEYEIRDQYNAVESTGFVEKTEWHGTFPCTYKHHFWRLRAWVDGEPGEWTDITEFWIIPSPPPSFTPTPTPTPPPPIFREIWPTMTATPAATTSPAIADDDRDGLSNEQEYTYGTSPTLRDTDGDGIEDGVEIALNTDPLNPADPASSADRDNDGLPDEFDPLPDTPDSDGDGYLDGYELAMGTDLADPTDWPSLGDVDDSGFVDNTDAMQIVLMYLGYVTVTSTHENRWDMNRDGSIDYIDCVILYNWFVGNIPYLPVNGLRSP